MNNNAVQPDRAKAIASALEAAKRVDRDSFLRALEGISLRSGKSAPLDERWLAAELAYLRGEYPKIIELFEGFESDPRSTNALTWQRYRSSHRLAFAYMHQGDDERAAPALRKARERIRELPDRAEREPDLDAMEGHLYNHHGNTELARARFVSAYQQAVALGNWGRAASSASDVATMFLNLGSLPEANEWLDRAEAALQKTPSALVAATLTVRRAHVRRTEQKFEQAERLYTEVIDGAERHPDPVEAAYRGRAETRLVLGRFDEAEADFRQAAEICLRQGIRNHAAYAYRGLADVHLARAGTNDPERAAAEFKRAMRLILTVQPPHPRMLIEFSEALLQRPRLLVGKLPEIFETQLRERISRLKALTRPDPMHIGTTMTERAKAYDDLRSTFAHLELSILPLQEHSVNLLTGRVTPSEKRKKISNAEFEVLQLLIDAPDGLTIDDIDRKLDIGLVAASRRTMRLKKLLGEDLPVTREGNVRRYSLRRVAQPPER